MDIIARNFAQVLQISAWFRGLLIALVLGVAIIVVAYIWGFRPKLLKALMTVKLPDWRDPRASVDLLSKNKNKWVKTIVSIPILLFIAWVVFALALPEHPAIANRFRKYQYPEMPAHLYVTHYENYSYLFFLNSALKSFNQIEDTLTFKNVTSEPLTDFRVRAYVYSNPTDVSDFLQAYSLTPGKSYNSIGEFGVNVMKQDEVFTLNLKDIYAKYRIKNSRDEAAINQLLLPEIGSQIQCAIENDVKKQGEIFTDNVSILNDFVRLEPRKNGLALKGVCGMPLKLIVSYRKGIEEFSSLLVGGTYYYGITRDRGMIVHPVSVASFVKPRLSVYRATPGSKPRVVNIAMEIRGERYVESPKREDESQLTMYTVTQPLGDEQYDMALPFNFDNNYAKDLADLYSKEINAGNRKAALSLVARISNLEPLNNSASNALKMLQAEQAAQK